MKRFITLICSAILLVFFVSACGTNNSNVNLISGQAKNETNTDNGKKEYKVALIMKTLTNPFFVEMEKGARKAATDLGVDLIVRTSTQETSIEQQIQIVDEMISQKVDAIVIAPGSSFEIIDVLKKAQSAGIKIVNIDNRLDQKESQKKGLINVPFISVRNDEGAYLSASYICKDIGKEKKEAAILEGIRDAENAQLRKEGALKAFGEHSNITVVASETANWKIDEAYNVTKSLFKKYPNISLMFCANDMMALGAVQYLKESGRRNVSIAGFDDLEDAKKEISAGWMKVTIDQQADAQGYKGIETAYKLIKGSKAENVSYVQVKVITKNTLTK